MNDLPKSGQGREAGKISEHSRLVLHRYPERAGASTDDSPPVVLIHGFTGSAASWGDVVDALNGDSHNAMEGNTEASAHELGEKTGSDGRNPILGVNLPGHAPNPCPVPSSFLDTVHGIAAQLEKALSRPALLAGYSLGGRIAVGLLCRHPHLSAGAILIGASAGLESPDERGARREADRRWEDLLCGAGIRAFVDQWSAIPILQPQSPVPTSRLEAQQTLRLGHDPMALAASLRSTGLGQMPYLREELSACALPIRFLVGGNDPKYRQLAQEMAAPLSDATVTAVGDCGHNLLLEAPEAVADSIARLRQEL